MDMVNDKLGQPVTHTGLLFCAQQIAVSHLNTRGIKIFCPHKTADIRIPPNDAAFICQPESRISRDGQRRHPPFDFIWQAFARGGQDHGLFLSIAACLR